MYAKHFIWESRYVAAALERSETCRSSTYAVFDRHRTHRQHRTSARNDGGTL